MDGNDTERDDKAMTTPPAPQAEPAVVRVPRWLAVTLVISLAANLLIAGAVIGHLAAGRPGPDPRGDTRDPAFAPLMRAMPHDAREGFERRLRAEAPRLRQNRAAMVERMDELVAALRAEPFEPEALQSTLAALRAGLSERTRLGDRLFVEHLATMPAASRLAMADRIEAALARARRGGRED